jgi:hypothetical protein
MKPQDENVARLLAGELSEAEAAELVRLIGKDPEALKRLGGQALVDGLLGAAMEDEFTRERRAQQVLAAVSRAEQDDFVAGVQTKIQHGRWRARVLAMAALVTVGVSVWLFSRPAAVATVARLETLRWGDGAAVAEGSAIQSGSRLRFESGLVELEMDGKGRMIVEGPADLEFIGAMESRLHRGRILMKVTEAGHGYRVATPKGSVIDLGTEFGVSVGDDAKVETHVLSGEVEAIPDGGTKVLLKKNDALRFDGGAGTRFTTDGSEFYTALPPLRQGTANVVHWPMEPVDEHIDRAQVEGFGPGAYDMLFQAMDGGKAPEPVSGKFGRAMAFDGKGGFGESPFLGIGGREPRTVSFWVRVPQDFNQREGFGIVSWGQFEGVNYGAVWQVSINPLEEEGPVGHLRVGAHGGQIIGTTDLRDGQWHHVAVVLYEGSQPDIGKHVLLYLDGELEPISRRALRQVNTQIDRADHGVWVGRNVVYTQSQPDHQHGGFFRGAVDEVFIFAGALSQGEIRGLMERNEAPVR